MYLFLLQGELIDALLNITILALELMLHLNKDLRESKE